MNSPPIYGIAIAPRVDDLPASALHVRPRKSAGSGQPAFPPRILSRVPCGPLQIALDEVLVKAEADSSDIASLSIDKPPLLDEAFERALRVASGRLEADG